MLTIGQIGISWIFWHVLTLIKDPKIRNSINFESSYPCNQKRPPWEYENDWQIWDFRRFCHLKGDPDIIRQSFHIPNDTRNPRKMSEIIPENETDRHEIDKKNCGKFGPIKVFRYLRLRFWSHVGDKVGLGATRIIDPMQTTSITTNPFIFIFHQINLIHSYTIRSIL